MNVTARSARIWRRDIETDNGSFPRYTTSVSKKLEDGSWSKAAYFRVVFSKKSGAPEHITNGAKCDFSGFMSVDVFKDREGKERVEPIIIVMEAHFEDEEDYDNFEQLEEDVPF